MSTSVAPHAPTLGANLSLGSLLLALSAAPLYDGKRTALTRTSEQLQLSAVSGPGKPLLWSHALFPSHCKISDTASVLGATGPLVSEKVIFVLGARASGGDAHLVAVAGQSGQALWAWAPPVEQGDAALECPVAIASDDRSVYAVSIGAKKMGRSSSGRSSIWRLSQRGGALAWRAPLCSSSACVPHAVATLSGGGLAALCSNETHLLLDRVDASGRRRCANPTWGIRVHVKDNTSPNDAQTKLRLFLWPSHRNCEYAYSAWFKLYTKGAVFTDGSYITSTKQARNRNRMRVYFVSSSYSG